MLSSLRSAHIGAVLVCQCCFLGIDLPPEIRAQSSPEIPLAFEVATIKPQPWTNQGSVGVFVRGNTLRGEHIDLYGLVEFAYGLRTDGFQLSGGPAWARHGILSDVSGFDSALYQVIAKAADGPPPSIERFRLMLQALLADRFHLSVHHARRDLPVFNLVVAKGGPKFMENVSDAKVSMAMRDGRVFRIRAVHAPITSLAEEFANPNHGAGRPVFDKTGLTGFYDYEIEWCPNDLASAGPDGSAPDTACPSVFAAVDRLGLKLVPGTAPLDTVVIDHAEKPSGN
ncbi:conserved exported hypothetical protein [Candidatus Sulfopaludibacter sp. SbA4]|nr:conserved exported hypothetical protein [Candidatus Sulfopaludibacter sp. SbA4]